MISAPLELARQLIRLRSITPEDAGCQDLVVRCLMPLAALDAPKSIYRQVLQHLQLPV